MAGRFSKAIGLIGAIFLWLTSPMAMAESCKATPEKIQLHFAFDWPLSARGSLAEILRLQCGEPENIARLGNRIEGFFRLAGVPVTRLTSLDTSRDEVAEFELITASDNGRERAIMFDLNSVEDSDGLIPVLQIEGNPQEGQELHARFATDQDFLERSGARIELQWKRDGQPISGAYKTRYTLQEADVGARVRAEITLRADNRILAYRSQAFVSEITMAEKKPKALNVAIGGKAEIGETLRLVYDFFDPNPEDSEQGSRIVWLRDEFSIPGANGPEYQITRADLGTLISVRIEPVSDDGMRGQAVTVSLSSPVEDKLLKQQQAILTEILGEVPNPNAGSAVPNRPASNEMMAALLSAPSQISDDDRPSPRLPNTSPLYLTKGLMVLPGAPRQITGLKIERSDLLGQENLQEIERRFTGQPIEIETLKQIIDAINLAFKEADYELSRALLPEQTITDGRIEIKIVEVRVGNINLDGNKQIDDDYILDQLGFEKGDYISLVALEEALKNYNATNKSKLKTELAPGADFGTTDIFIQTEEPSRIELPTLSVDNYNKGLSKLVPQSFSATFNNLFGRDDEVSVSLSDGIGTSAYTIGYSAPFGYRGGNLSLNLAQANTQSNVENAELVGYRGTSTSFGLGYSYPLFSTQYWSGFSSVSFGRGENDMVAPVTGDLLAKSKTDKAVFSFPASFNNGVTAFSVSPAWHIIHSRTEIPPSNKWVSKYDMDISASHFVNPQLTANFSGRYLYTNARAFLNMPDEIISIGGPGSVRAYRPSESSGYRGYFASAELRSDLANWENITLPEWLPNIQPYAFIDHVNAREVYKEARRGDHWSGYGFGLTLPKIFNYLYFDTYWAHPLDNSVHQEEKDAYKDDLLQFTLRANIKLN